MGCQSSKTDIKVLKKEEILQVRDIDHKILKKVLFDQHQEQQIIFNEENMYQDKKFLQVNHLRQSKIDQNNNIKSKGVKLENQQKVKIYDESHINKAEEPRQKITNEFQYLHNKEKHVLKVQKKQQKQQMPQCMICLDKLSNIKTNCNHLFCKQCIQRAVKRYNFCPYCRKFDPLGKKKIQHKGEIPSEFDWDVEIARKILFKDEGQDGMRRIYLQNNGMEEQTNIFVSKNAKIQCSPSANIFINGQKINPNQCNQQ